MFDRFMPDQLNLRYSVDGIDSGREKARKTEGNLTG